MFPAGRLCSGLPSWELSTYCRKHCPVGRRENRPFCPAAVWGFARCPLGTAALQVAKTAAACIGCVLEAAFGLWASFCLHLDASQVILLFLQNLSSSPFVPLTVPMLGRLLW